MVELEGRLVLWLRRIGDRRNQMAAELAEAARLIDELTIHIRNLVVVHTVVN